MVYTSEVFTCSSYVYEIIRRLTWSGQNCGLGKGGGGKGEGGGGKGEGRGGGGGGSEGEAATEASAISELGFFGSRGSDVRESV